MTDGHLPSEKDIKKRKYFMIGFGILVFSDWIAYSIINVNLSAKSEFRALQLFNFTETILLAFFIFMTWLFFSVAYCRIYKLNKQLGGHEGNQK